MSKISTLYPRYPFVQKWVKLNPICEPHWMARDTQHCYSVATTLKMNIISQSWGNVASILVYHCSNVATTLENYVIPRCCHNVATTLKTTLYHNVRTTFRQRCVNVVWKVWPNLTKLHHSGNIVTTFRRRWKLCNFQHCYNVVTTLPESCVNVVGWPKYHHSQNIEK